jgi:hypothetical protein
VFVKPHNTISIYPPLDNQSRLQTTKKPDF